VEAGGGAIICPEGVEVGLAAEPIARQAGPGDGRKLLAETYLRRCEEDRIYLCKNGGKDYGRENWHGIGPGEGLA
jgi:hypothetical protein